MSDTRSPIDRLHAIIARDGLDSLTEAEAGLLGIYWFVMETNNGGVHQFFVNDSGRFAAPALRYLEQVGAAMTASILRRAIALFPGGNVPTELNARRALLDAMDEQGVSFSPLTTELFKAGEDVNELHVAYANAHPALFARVRG